MSDAYPFDLGSWQRKITTTSAQAQIWFDRGLNWTYGYNQEEAVACFQNALRHDPDCAMAHWGIALAHGPFYNRPWVRFSDPEIPPTLQKCHDAARRAKELAATCTKAEHALIDAIQLRYQGTDTLDHATLNGWHDAYTDAMRAVHAAFPDDPDITALFVEAAVTRTPRQLWDIQTGAPLPDSDIVEVMEVMGDALARCNARGITHPGLAHMHIHALEISSRPEEALVSADALCGFSPDAGHLHHMPGHIYVLMGDYDRAVQQSEWAVAANDRYLAHAGARNFYTTARCHDFHLLMFAAMFQGHFAKALSAADRICAEATQELIDWAPPFMGSILDGYSAMRIHVLVRFGRWQDLADIAERPDPAQTPIRAAMLAYGQCVAHAALGQIAEANAARERFYDIYDTIPEEAIFLSNPIRAMLAVGAAMMEGELAYHKGDHEAGFDHLRRGVARNDALNYTEPWAWMHPPRHALGALLAEQGQYSEAEQVFRADMGLVPGAPRCSQHPANIWALRGLLECVEHRGAGDEAKAIARQLEQAQRQADVPVTAACCCRKS